MSSGLAKTKGHRLFPDSRAPEGQNSSKAVGHIVRWRLALSLGGGGLGLVTQTYGSNGCH